MATLEIKCKVKKTVWYYIILIGVKLLRKIANKPLMECEINGKKSFVVKLSDFNLSIQ